MAVVTSIMRLQQVFLARADAVLRPLGLTFARYEVLMLLSFARRDALPLGKIGERLQVNAASVTNAVDRLEADGLVARRSNPDDGRVTLAALTPSGRRTATEATGRSTSRSSPTSACRRRSCAACLPCWRSSGRLPGISRSCCELL